MYTFQSKCPHTQHTPTGPGKNGKSIATHLTKHYNSFEIVLSSLWDRNPFIFPIQMQNSPQISSVSRCTIYRNVRDARVPNWILAYYTLFFLLPFLSIYLIIITNNTLNITLFVTRNEREEKLDNYNFIFLCVSAFITVFDCNIIINTYDETTKPC